MARTSSSYSPEEKVRIAQMGLANRGRKHTPEELEKMRLAGLSRKQSAETRVKISKTHLGSKNPNFGKAFSPEYRAKLSASHTGPKNHQYGKPQTPEVRAKISASLKGPKHPNFGKPRDSEIVRKILRSNGLKPNKAEIRLQTILDNHFPNQWKYVGRGDFVIHGLSPDFLNINREKCLIELFGTHWHSDEVVQRADQTEAGRIAHYAKYGFKCVVVWENELRDEKTLLGKIKSL